ncbi:MAG: hypothetical protein WDO13_20835 [Verrucomicrobiota bacterium]
MPPAATNAAPAEAAAPGQTATSGAADANGATSAPPDLSGLSRAELEARVRTLTDSLAAANNESEYFREQWTELKLRDEALGVTALTGDKTKLEDRLVQAVAELYRSEMKRREGRRAARQAPVHHRRDAPDRAQLRPQGRAEYEITSRSARAYLSGHSGSAIPLATSLADARVADTNPELNAVILNLGKSLGVKEGMAFRIYQDTLPVATVKIVLARDLVSAAQVETIKPNAVVRVGDRATVETQ